MEISVSVPVLLRISMERGRISRNRRTGEKRGSPAALLRQQHCYGLPHDLPGEFFNQSPARDNINDSVVKNFLKRNFS
jgi:hypothetical protein